MMTKKDYERAAAIVATMAQDKTFACRQEVSKAFCDLFRGDNPRFSSERFINACFPEIQS